MAPPLWPPLLQYSTQSTRKGNIVVLDIDATGSKQKGWVIVLKQLACRSEGGTSLLPVEVSPVASGRNVPLERRGMLKPCCAVAPCEATCKISHKIG